MNQHRYCATPVLYGMSWRRWKHFSLPHTIITLKTSISHIHSNAPQIRLLSCTHHHRKCHISVMHWTKIACLKARYFSPYIFTSIPKYLHLYMRVFWVLNLIHTRAGRHKLQTHTHIYTITHIGYVTTVEDTMRWNIQDDDVFTKRCFVRVRVVVVAVIHPYDSFYFIQFDFTSFVL